MKSKYVILASALLISVSNFAQKDQIKAAEKAMKSGNSAEAIAALTQAESTIGSATDAEKAQYYFVKGNALADLANKKVETGKNLSGAAKAYQEVLTVEKTSGKSKYTADAKTALADMKSQLINAAVDAGTAKNYKVASDLLYQAYELDKTDLEKLYYAANYAVNAEDYDRALSLYADLKKQNFSGEGTSYFAKNALNDQEEFFGSNAAAKADRDTKVRLKLYTNPRDEKVPSKRGEIYKNIALILVQQGKTEEAKKALAEAREANPDDTSITLTEANVYLELNDFVTYKRLITDVLAKNPNDADLVYNLGVIASKTDVVEAEKYYKRAIEIKPDYISAYLNLAIMKLDADKKIIDEMNKLGTSEKDTKRYEVLKKQRNDMFNSALPYLEKAYELEPGNADVAATLLNVYGALEMTDKKKALKAKMGK
ncbi:tetratricopeptide repeat protein [Flavobacterium sp.]|uniref:tetratricopeptide repeat protein n=1 Tax=Flavobacterium sp. TaxID=239 RepID=UPI00286C51AA|nr:tetratricopeptide repeat protein [Flavobacterium sp.]